MNHVRKYTCKSRSHKRCQRKNKVFYMHSG